MSDNNRWAVRDIKHGKTFFFRNWQDLVAFINDSVPGKPFLVRKEK